MKFELTFKTPNVSDQLDYLRNDPNYEQILKEVKKYIVYNEYVNIIFNTKEGIVPKLVLK